MIILFATLSWFSKELRKSTFENVESTTEMFNELMGRYSENADVSLLIIDTHWNT